MAIVRAWKPVGNTARLPDNPSPPFMVMEQILIRVTRQIQETIQVELSCASAFSIRHFGYYSRRMDHAWWSPVTRLEHGMETRLLSVSSCF
jgi:hypothetical protein